MYRTPNVQFNLLKKTIFFKKHETVLIYIEESVPLDNPPP